MTELECSFICSVQQCLKDQGTNEDDDETVTSQVAPTASVTIYRKLIDYPEYMPVFTTENVLDYMIYRKEKDCMRAEDWKNFKGGGFKLFKEGHVQNIMINRQGAVFGVKCRCLPEMKKDKFYNINLDISMDNSSVMQAECSCPAGKGPHGSCKHIAAVLFAIDNFYACYEEAKKEDEVTCTSKLQTWNQPRKRRLDSKAANEISFKVESYLHTPIRKSKDFFDPRPPALQKTTADELQELSESLKQLKSSCGFLDIMVPRDDIPSKLPLTPRSVQSRIKTQIIKECDIPPTLEAVISYSDAFVQMLQSDERQRKALEIATRRQSACKLELCDNLDKKIIVIICSLSR